MNLFKEQKNIDKLKKVFGDEIKSPIDIIKKLENDEIFEKIVELVD